MISTGEEIPAGHSLRARMVVLQVKHGDIDPAKLSGCQRDSANGLHARATSGYLKWFAPMKEGVELRIAAGVQKVRDQSGGGELGVHRRLPDTAAHIMIGFDSFVQFALESGAIDASRAETLRQRAWDAVVEAMRSQEPHHEAADPVARFPDLLGAALSAGKAHLVSIHGGPPDNYPTSAVGWHLRDASDGGLGKQWIPRGTCIGWLTDEFLYLIPAAAHEAAQSFAGDHERIAISERTLGRRLSERKLLVSEDRERRRYTIRIPINGTRMEVLHLRASYLFGIAPTPQGPENPSGEPETHNSTGDTGSKDPNNAPEDRPRPQPPPMSWGAGAIGAITQDGAPRGDARAHPPASAPRACFNCKGTAFWHRAHSTELICGKCYPPTDPTTAVWITIPNSNGAPPPPSSKPKQSGPPQPTGPEVDPNDFARRVGRGGSR